jgi:hypothetical protein
MISSTRGKIALIRVRAESLLGHQRDERGIAPNKAAKPEPYQINAMSPIGALAP